MANGRDKEFSRHKRLQIQKLFALEWDPIGITDGDETDDEYNSYAAQAYVMAINGKTADEIAEYLFDTESNYIGMGPRPGRREACRAIAEKTITIALQKPN